MEQKDIVKIILSIAAGLVFVIGFGIGVQLHESTTENDKKEKIDLSKYSK